MIFRFPLNQSDAEENKLLHDKAIEFFSGAIIFNNVSISDNGEEKRGGGYLTPHIRLSGLKLAEMGFHTGAKYQVEMKQGEITLKLFTHDNQA